MIDILAEVTRSGIVESRHFGHVAVSNSKGELLDYAGEIQGRREDTVRRHKRRA